MYGPLVATVEYGDFEWDDAKAESNLAKHGVSFEEAAWAMKDPLSLDFDDLVEPDNLSHVGSVAGRAHPLHRLDRSRRPDTNHQCP